MTDISIVFVTTGSENEAIKIGQVLVEEKLAACANIVPKIRSIYRWKGDIRSDEEYLMIMKTRSSLFPALKKRVCELHSYEVPEVITFPISEGQSEYLNWVIDNTLAE